MKMVGKFRVHTKGMISYPVPDVLPGKKQPLDPKIVDAIENGEFYKSLEKSGDTDSLNMMKRVLHIS